MKQYNDSENKYFQIGKFKISHLKNQPEQVQNFIDYFKKQVNNKIHTTMHRVWNGTQLQDQIRDLPYSSQQLLNNSYFQIRLYSQEEFQNERRHKNQTQQTTLIVEQFMEEPESMKMPFQTFSLKIVPFLGSVQQWQIQFLQIAASYNKNQKLKFIQKTQNMIGSLLRNLSQIRFQNLKQLTLVKLQMKNIQFLTFMNLSKVSKIFLQSNSIRSIKPLNKIKRNTNEQQVIVGLLNNVSQFVLDRIEFGKPESIQSFIDIYQYDRLNKQKSFYFTTSLNFLVKSRQWDGYCLGQYWKVEKRQVIKSLKSPNKLNKILSQLIKH